MPIKPKSIVVKYKNEDSVLKAIRAGASNKDVATLCGVSQKTVWSVKNKHSAEFPKKEKKKKGPLGKPFGWRKPDKGVRRWVTVPAGVDEKIVVAARAESRTWQEQANFIFMGWGDDK